ncbi:hypothetical protein NESM_000708400 [Novymonas esmeraldas]|uniref:SRP9 domain-containing protein n=1 Tax=Novymonas esmeraldas TaxID=1808958 RepID=A0AAW0ETI4_9TRYP
MRVELREFAQATRRLHQQPGGVRRTRLMLRVRPFSSRKTFVLKATDGRTTVTARVDHQGQLKLVEGIVNDFVAECTHAAATAATTTAAGAAVSAAAAAPAVASVVTGKGSAPSSTGTQLSQGVHAPSPSPQQQQQQQQQHGGNAAGRQTKGKKGKRH